MRLAKTAVVLTGVFLLGLGGCDKLPGGGSGDAATDPVAGKKLDTYVEANNRIVGTFGFEEKVEAYRKSDIAHASGDGDFTVEPGSINKAVVALRTARAMSGGSAALDAAADALATSMDTVATHLAALEPYYRSKKYLEDKFARGKAEDPKVLAEIDTAEKDFAAFGKLLDTALDQRDAVLLDKLKSADPVKYQSKLALMHAKKLISLFDSPEDAKKPATLAKADAEVAIVEQAIADAHTEASKQGKADPTGMDELTLMIGEYRSFKREHEIYQLRSMLTRYNNAVETSNGLAIY